ncbi:MAG: DUF58 domain-containing protein [Clostridiales bacterium]|nr:DUF58 domain-containing protein [Clostridiales bacterium]
MNTALLTLLLGLLVLGQGTLFRRRALKRLTYSRTFSSRTAFVGEEVALVEVIGNRKLLPLPWLKAESRLSTALRFGGTETSSEESRQVSDNQAVAYHSSVFFLGPYSRVTRRHRVTPLKRGVFSARSVALTCGDLFGTNAAQQQLDVDAELIVYPRLVAEQDAPLPSSREQGDLIVRRWIAPDPFLIQGIRPYRAGDAQRDVHWAATARTGSLQVKARDYTADPHLLVLLNVQLKVDQWGDLMEYEQDEVETAISHAATLCLQALRAGVGAGLAANAPIVPGGEPLIMMPERSAGRDTEILEALARLRILRIRTMHAFLDDLSGVTGLDIVVLTAYTDEWIEERLQALRRAGNSVTVQWPGRGTA